MVAAPVGLGCPQWTVASERDTVQQGRRQETNTLIFLPKDKPNQKPKSKVVLVSVNKCQPRGHRTGNKRIESGSRGINRKYPAKPKYHGKNVRPGFNLFCFNSGNNSMWVRLWDPPFRLNYLSYLKQGQCLYHCFIPFIQHRQGTNCNVKICA